MNRLYWWDVWTNWSFTSWINKHEQSFFLLSSFQVSNKADGENMKCVCVSTCCYINDRGKSTLNNFCSCFNIYLQFNEPLQHDTFFPAYRSDMLTYCSTTFCIILSTHCSRYSCCHCTHALNELAALSLFASFLWVTSTWKFRKLSATFTSYRPERDLLQPRWNNCLFQSIYPLYHQPTSKIYIHNKSS